ncbi:MAG: GNAT family N-acetyltransferase [Thermomicrobiales bacterium]
MRDHLSITFRPLAHDDLPLMHRWLNVGEAFKWYGLKPTTLDEITTEYTPTIDQTEPVFGFVILVDDRPAGYIQWYLIHDHPDYARQVDVPADSAGIDLFIGEETFIHRGLGAPILRAFLREIVFADDRVGRCLIGPDERNAIAIRSYEKAGFRHFKTVPIADEPAPEYLMEITKEELFWSFRACRGI